MKFLSWLRCYVVRMEERLRNMHILERVGDVDRRPLPVTAHSILKVCLG